MTDDLEFWSIRTVCRKVGLSRSTVYRLAREGRFPASRPYKNTGTERGGRVFWLSTDVEAWMADQVGDDDVARLIG